MNCESVSNRIDDYLDGDLPAPELEAVSQHLSSCTACREEVESARTLLEQLSQLEAPQPRPGYEQRVLRFLEQEKIRREPARQSLSLWFTTGFVTAALAIFGILFMTNNPLLRQADPLPVVTVELTPMQTRKVDLVFNSPVEIRDASMRIELPEGTEIAGYPNTDTLEWKTSLKQGTNRLSLPLIIRQKNGGTLFAKINHSGKTRVFKLNIVSLPASSVYPTSLSG